MDYYRITAYHSDEDISVILDSNGKFESLWDFSSLLVAHGFKVISLSKSNAFAESTFPLIDESKKLAVRAIAKGLYSRVVFRILKTEISTKSNESVSWLAQVERYYCFFFAAFATCSHY